MRAAVQYAYRGFRIPLPLDVECSSFAVATARQVSACHAEAFGVGGLDIERLLAALRPDRLSPLTYDRGPLISDF
jgi:hypothetical protein